MISSSNTRKFWKKIISISKREPAFGDATRGNLQIKGQAKNCSLRLKTSSIDKAIACGSGKFEITHENLRMGEFLNDGLVYQSHFLVKSYESRPDNKMSMFFILNQLLESKLDHFKSCGLMKTGFGTTLEMTKRGLIWVIHKWQVVVDKYPYWNDIVQLRTWCCIHGKNSYRRDWIVRDHKTGEVLFRAICFFVLMNKKTRKLSKFCVELKDEMKPYFLDSDPIIEEDEIIITTKLDIHAHNCNHTSLVTKSSDLDMNQHVNNASYINFILESIPGWVSKKYELSSVTMKYLKECSIDKKLESLSVPIKNDDLNIKDEDIKFHHSIILTHGVELVRATTLWTPKST